MAAIDVRVVGLAGPYMDYPRLIAEELRRNGLHCEYHSVPFVRVRDLGPATLRELRRELRKAPSTAVSVYSPGVTEVFLREADIGVHFSAFATWFDPERICVLPHHWPVAAPLPNQSLEWASKPKFSVGFMGTAYADSRAARLLGSHLSPGMKQWALEGRYLRFPDAVALTYKAKIPIKYAATFPRAEAIETLKACARRVGAEVHIVDTAGFTGKDDQKEEYARHMEGATYILCPRGSENYSFRFYEALRFGRVPVLIDTDTVLPDGIDWDELIVRVPYVKLAEIGDIIARDYRTKSAAEFIARQKAAFRLISELDSGAWINGLLEDIRKRLAAKLQNADIN